MINTKRNFWLKFAMLLLIVNFACPIRVASGDQLHTPGYYDVNVRKLYAAQDYKRARKLLEQGLKTYPTNSTLNQLMGMYYLRHNQYEKARYYLYRGVRYNSGNHEAKRYLLAVEERTRNYSSAICYINELLEVQPYDKALWLKKIGIYRLQGNIQEADRLLQRLVDIFPNDTDLRNRLKGRMEEDLKQAKDQRNLQRGIASLRRMIKNDPSEMENYLTLSNLLLQAGRPDDALAVTSEALAEQPGSLLLAEKKASILAGMRRYDEAKEYIKSYQQRYGGSGTMGQMLNSIEEEAAGYALNNDPFLLYSRLYAKKKSADALDFLLNTSVSRGYTSDALYYIGEAKKMRGETPELLYKEYEIYKRIGNERKAMPLLEKILKKQPRNTDVADELANYRSKEASDLMLTQNYAEALPLLRFVRDHAADKDLKQSAMNKMYTCYFDMRQYDNAAAMLDSIRAAFPQQDNIVLRMVDVLNKDGKTPQALAMLESELDKTSDDTRRALYLNAYEETAIPYIKSLMAAGATKKAMKQVEALLRYYPASPEGLLYAINASALLNNDANFAMYTKMALGYYPNDLRFRIKGATMLRQQGNPGEAIVSLLPLLDEYTNDSLLIGAFSEASDEMAHMRMKEHKNEEALQVLNTALRYDANNQALLLSKGLAFEALKQYDSAFVYKNRYQPTLMEVAQHKENLDWLQNKSYANQITVEYRQARYGEEDMLTSVATLGYTRLLPRNNYSLRLNYAGRDGKLNDNLSELNYGPGGVGVQLQAEWEHRFNEKTTGRINVAGATKYFPRIAVNVGVDRQLGVSWLAEIHAGYRQVELYSKRFEYMKPDTLTEGGWIVGGWDKNFKSVLLLGAGLTKSWEQFSLGGKLDGLMYGSQLTVNGSLTGAFMPSGSRLKKLVASVSAGTAPQSEVIDVAYPNMFKKLNTSVSFGGTYLLSKNLTFNLMGSWNTFSIANVARVGTATDYVDTTSHQYKNLFSVDGTLVLSF